MVLVLKGDDIDCVGQIGSIMRYKKFKLSITPNITKKEGIKAASIALIIGIAFCCCYIIGVVTHNVRLRRQLRRQLTSESETLPRPEELLTPEIEEVIFNLIIVKVKL